MNYVTYWNGFETILNHLIGDFTFVKFMHTIRWNIQSLPLQ